MVRRPCWANTFSGSWNRRRPVKGSSRAAQGQWVRDQHPAIPHRLPAEMVSSSELSSALPFRSLLCCPGLRCRSQPQFLSASQGWESNQARHLPHRTYGHIGQPWPQRGLTSCGILCVQGRTVGLQSATTTGSAPGSWAQSPGEAQEGQLSSCSLSASDHAPASPPPWAPVSSNPRCPGAGHPQCWELPACSTVCWSLSLL